MNLALLIHALRLDPQKIVQAQQLILERRGTYSQLSESDIPPQEWQEPFQALAAKCGLPRNCEAALETVQAFLQEVMAKR